MNWNLLTQMNYRNQNDYYQQVCVCVRYLVIRDNHVNSPSWEVFRYSYVYMLDQHINYNASNNSVKFETLLVFCSLPLSHAVRIIMLDVSRYGEEFDYL